MPLAYLARLREGTYRLFSQMFLYPDRERLTAVGAVATGLWQEREALARFAFFRQWSEVVDSLKNLGQRGLPGIETAYVSLFAANAEGIPCPPYESVYREPAGRPTGWLLAQVESEYATAGFALSPTLGELPDHVAVEMEFMALLCDREAQAWEERIPTQGIQAVRRQRAFLESHLAVWFPEFARQIMPVDSGGAYAAVAEGAQAFISHDRDLQGALLETLSASNRGITKVRGPSDGSG
jgi:TorA maturation chaperone TorD